MGNCMYVSTFECDEPWCLNLCIRAQIQTNDAAMQETLI